MTRFMIKQPKPTWDPLIARAAPRCVCGRGPVKHGGKCDECHDAWLLAQEPAAATARPHQTWKPRTLATMPIHARAQASGPLDRPPRYLLELARDPRGPFGVADQEIEQTEEYRSFMDRMLAWQWKYHATPAESLLACRLILRDLARRHVEWYGEAVRYFLEARRSLAQPGPAAPTPAPAAPAAGPPIAETAPAQAPHSRAEEPKQGPSREPDGLTISRHVDPGIPPLRDDLGVDLLGKARALVARLRHFGNDAAAAQVEAILGDVVVLAGAVAAILGGFYTGWQYVEGAIVFDWSNEAIAQRVLEYPRRVRRAEPDIVKLEKALGALERAMVPHSDLVFDLSPPQRPSIRLDIEPLRQHVGELERWMEPPGEARGPTQPSQPTRDLDTGTRDRCEPQPACPHAGGDAIHDSCADREPPNIHPGCDVEVDGRRFDALSPGRILWEVKTDDWSRYPEYLRGITLDRYVALADADLAKAASCGYGYRFAVADGALFELLEDRLPRGVAVHVPRCSRR